MNIPDHIKQRARGIWALRCLQDPGWPETLCSRAEFWLWARYGCIKGVGVDYGIESVTQPRRVGFRTVDWPIMLSPSRFKKRKFQWIG